MKSLHTIAAMVALSLLSTTVSAEEEKAVASTEKKVEAKAEEVKAAPKKVAKKARASSGMMSPDAPDAMHNTDRAHFDTNAKYVDPYEYRRPNTPQNEVRMDDARSYDGRYDSCRWRGGRGLSGWFIGLQAGMNGVRTKDRVNAGSTQVNNRGGSLGGVAGIFLGWGRNFSSHGYAGLQLEGNLVDAKTQNNTSVTGGGQNTTTKTNGVWGAALLLGFRPWASHNTMIYVRLGADMARWRVNATGSPVATSVTGSASKTKVAFAPGLGVRSMMYKNMFLNMEYKFAAYDGIRALNSNGNGNSVESKPTMQTFMVGIGWNF